MDVKNRKNYVPKPSGGYPFCFDAAIAAVSFILMGYLVEKRFAGTVDSGIHNMITCIAGFAGTMLYCVNPIILTVTYLVSAE